MTRRPAVSRFGAMGALALLLAGCGGSPVSSPSDVPTNSADLTTACRQAAETDSTAQLTYDQALALPGRGITACEITIPPARGEPQVIQIPASFTADPQFAAGLAMDRPQPPGCDTVAQSTVLFLVIDGAIVEARQCGTSHES